MLVALAIVSILAVMPLPALEQARESANSTNCANSLKQLMLVVFEYVDNNDGNSMPYQMPGGGEISWRRLLHNQGYLPANDALGLCPSGPKPRSGAYGMIYDTYGVQVGLGGAYFHFTKKRLLNGGYALGYFNPVDVPDSRLPYFADTIIDGTPQYQTYYYYSWCSSSRKAVDPRHLNRGNLSFFDGHVAACDTATLLDLGIDGWHNGSTWVIDLVH